MIEVVSFDVWSTLLWFNPDYSRLRAEKIRAFFGYPAALAGGQAEKKISSAMHVVDRLVENGERSLDFDFRLNYLASIFECMLPHPDIQRELQQELAELYLQYLPRLTEDDLPQTFATLRAMGLQLAVVSNTGMTSGQTVHDILDRHGLARYLSHEFYSDERVFAKPNRQLFQAVASETGSEPMNILHIGDNPLTDVRGAKIAGFQSRLYTPFGGGDATSVVRLADLPNMLQH